MRKAVLLDRDGTINVDHGYLHDPEKLEFLPRAVEALQLLQEAGYILIIITNQSGIGRGYFTEGQYQRFNDALVAELKLRGVEIAATYMCPHAPSEPCACRKPAPAMALEAIRDFDIDAARSFMLGDKLSDVECGRAAGLTARQITKEQDLLYWTNEILRGEL